MKVEFEYGKNPAAIRNLVWSIAGSGLIASKMLSLVADNAGAALASSALLTAVAFAFAFGVRGHGSVLGERSIGRFALAAYGISQLLGTILVSGPEAWFVAPAGFGGFVAIANSVIGSACLTLCALALIRGDVVHKALSWPLFVLAGLSTIVAAAVLVPTLANDFRQSSETLQLSVGVVAWLANILLPILLGLAAVIASLRSYRRYS